MKEKITYIVKWLARRLITPCCRVFLLFYFFTFVSLPTSAQKFFNLTADEVKVDSLLPVFSHSFALGGHYADSVYTVSIDYPEFIDMSQADVARYQQITTDELPAMPKVETFIGTSRRKGTLYASLVPLVFRNGKFQKLVSFKLTVHAQPATKPTHTNRAATKPTAEERYAAHSVLANGTWAKIRVPETGIYHLSDAVIRQAGFSNPARVRIYGYGGALQPEVLTGNYLAETDDLKEVPTCTVNGRRLFRAVGPVSWSSNTATQRTRNPYSDYGYYFLTESDGEPLTTDSATFVASFYPSADDYHSLTEKDEYAWYHSGRNLYYNELISTSGTTYQITSHDTSGKLTVVITYNAAFQCSVSLNGKEIGNLSSTSILGDYQRALSQAMTFNVDSLQTGKNDVTIKQLSGKEVRLDYITLTTTTPKSAPSLSGTTFPSPEYVYRITNQDHHADTAADMVIIIPTSQKVLAQATRLKELHETNDSMRVRIVPADELYNEFSSGTPDANAYRRYLKMLYDRAETDANMPRYLLLFGDGAWDNRMLTSNWSGTSPDDFLLCYESENSFSETDSYVSDDYYCMLDDGEGGDIATADKADIGVGRMTARTDADAKIMVDKTIGYYHHDYAGDWQNTVCFMGDDRNGNIHMTEAEMAAQTVHNIDPAFNIRRFYWDAYKRTSTSTGNHYPDVERLVKQQMQAGALIMDYCGHGKADQISHERVLTLSDFTTQTSQRLPLWITASCDIMPYDTQEENIGETAMLNPHGGAVAFFGTTRTVYTGANAELNCAFLTYLLTTTDGHRNTLGDAVRLAKNELRANNSNYKFNKLHYSLLGDPALVLASPQRGIVVDEIAGVSSESNTVKITAGTPITVKGHITDMSDFNGTISLKVKDVEENIVCQLNEVDDQTETAFEYKDRPTILYSGSDSIRNGQFTMVFVLPRDISYSDANGQMLLYASSNDHQSRVHGYNENFTTASASTMANDGVGPSIYCYLNNRSFVNGGNVNTTPYFYAELNDKEGINASGSGIGHDLELVIDGEQTMTYTLNNYFQYDFGDYRNGTVGYSLPELSEGEHRLQFRAWDIVNNSSVAELKFNVVRGLTPEGFSVDCTRNPATTSTTFVLTHDRIGCTLDVELEVFDMSGRQLYGHSETGVSSDNTYTLDWDLTTEGGKRLSTGVYLYRVLVSCDGSKKASQAKKLIIL